MGLQLTHFQITATWTGFKGAPGYTRLRFTSNSGASADDCANAMRTWFAACAAYIPNTIRINWDGNAPIFDENGNLVDVNVYTPPATVSGSTAVQYPGPAGAVVDWLTSSFRNNRRVRGRSFLVPLGNCYDTDGSLQGTALSALQNAGNALVGAGVGMIVWSRPAPGSISGGAESPVMNALVPDFTTVLRSRRD